MPLAKERRDTSDRPGPVIHGLVSLRCGRSGLRGIPTASSGYRYLPLVKRENDQTDCGQMAMMTASSP